MGDVKNGCVQELKPGLHMQSNRTTVTTADTDGSSDMGEKSHFIVIHFKIMGQNLWVRVSSMNHYALVHNDMNIYRFNDHTTVGPKMAQ